MRSGAPSRAGRIARRCAGVELGCEARLLRGGIEGRIGWNGSELCAFLLPGDREMCAWAKGKRAELEEQGWRPVDVAG
jgi:hypothetical protein